MLKYIAKRVLLIIPVVIGITFFIFLVLSYAPGDPASLMLGPDATAEQLEELREELGLNKPVLLQYFDYMKKVILHGDFGTSWLTGESVFKTFLQRAPNTLLLASLTIAIVTIIGIPTGIVAAIRQNTLVDHTSLAFALVFSSTPSFWLALLAQVFFAYHMGWLPSIGADSMKHFILPAATLSAVNLASQVRMTRSSMLDVIGQDYIRTARAKGASESHVVVRHVVRNGILPVITNLGIAFASSFGGAVVTESVFSIPGIGSYMINAAKSRDIPIVMGVIIFVAIFVAVLNLLVDLIYAFVDPRVKAGYTA